MNRIEFDVCLNFLMGSSPGSFVVDCNVILCRTGIVIDPHDCTNAYHRH